MTEQHTHGFRNTVLALVAVPAFVICPAWIYLQSQEIWQKSLYIANQHDSIDFLQRQLAEIQTRNVVLQEKLQLLQNDLENTTASLDDELAKNWQEKYENFQEQYLQTRQHYEQQTNTAMNEEARLQRALRYYQSENHLIKKKWSDLDEKQNKSDEKIVQLVAENDRVSRMMAKLEKQLHKSREQVAEKPVVVKNLSADTGKTRQYRRIRLQSLQNALVNQDSGTRKVILLDVIPTIPSGLNVTELLPLVEGMNSGDILAVIQATHQYVIRPIDNNAISLLAGTMNDEDAVTASLVLSSQ